MKILILTQPLRTNYGGLLQAYALQKVLKRMGHEVITDKNNYRGVNMKFAILYTINRIFKGGILRNKRYLPVIPRLMTKNIFELISQNTEKFINNHIETVDFFNGTSKPSKNNIDKYDMFVVGSDQVWRKEYNQYMDNYFLSFLNGRKDKKTLIYAASFGVDNIDSNIDTIYKDCFKLLDNISAISVREENAVKILKEQANIDALHVLDPTLLLEKEDYLELIEDEDMELRNNIMMSYVLDRTEEKTKIVMDISSKLNLEVFEVMPYKNFSTNNKHDIKQMVFPSVSRWLSGFRDAKFVVTDSFHGTVFSIIFNKPFIVIANKERGLSRFTSLLKIFGLEDRLIFNDSEFKNIKSFDLDYNYTNLKKQELKNYSLSFIKDNLK